MQEPKSATAAHPRLAAPAEFRRLGRRPPARPSQWRVLVARSFRSAAAGRLHSGGTFARRRGATPEAIRTQRTAPGAGSIVARDSLAAASQPAAAAPRLRGGGVRVLGRMDRRNHRGDDRRGHGSHRFHSGIQRPIGRGPAAAARALHGAPRRQTCADRACRGGPRRRHITLGRKSRFRKRHAALPSRSSCARGGLSFEAGLDVGGSPSR